MIRSLLLVAAIATPALADPDPAPEDAALHSSVGWGNSVNPHLVSLSTEAGYDGAQQRAEATALVEATLFWRVSAFAAVTYGEETTGASRPAIGAAVQIIDPRTSPVGVRVSSAYKPEGFSEPEGELETIIVLSHMFDRNVARVFGAFGTDPDGNESDVEAGAGYLHRVTNNIVVGATTRYRYAIAVKNNTGPRWDFIGGGVGDYAFGRWRLEVLLGGGATHVIGESVSGGLLGLASVGVDL